jgi:FixJ family two-component response regulator
MTGHGDMPTTVRALKAAGVEFLVNPFCEGEILRAIPRALEISTIRLCDLARLKVFNSLYSYLSLREGEVIGADSVRTV